MDATVQCNLIKSMFLVWFDWSKQQMAWNCRMHLSSDSDRRQENATSLC